MKVGCRFLTSAALTAVGALLGPLPALAQDAKALLGADANAKDWVTYHGSYKSWNYSPLNQINAENVRI